MADNVTFQTTVATPPANTVVGTREVTVGGDTAMVQIIVPIAVTGAEGAYTAREWLIADDAAFTPGTNAVAMFGAEFDDTSPDSVDEGDAGALRMSSRRELYVQLRDAAGNERGANINASGQLAIAGPVTNAGTFAVQVDGAALTSLQLIDDPVIADDAAFTPATSKVMMAGFEFDDSAPDSVDEGDAGAARMSSRREVYIQIRDAAGNERGANVNASGQLAVAGPVTNAGTFAVQVDGSALTALQLIDNIVLAEDVAHQDGDPGVQMLAVRDDTLNIRSGAENDYEPLHTNANGALWAIDVNSASALTALQLIDDPVVQDDTAFTPATTKVMMAGFEADESSTDSVDEGDGGAGRMTLDRKIIVNPQPHTAGGLSVFMASGSDGSSILVATAQAAKASAGQLYGYYLYNPEAAVTFVHFYNTAQGSVTVGTTNPLFTLAIPAGSAANLMGAHGIPFDTAITVAATTTAGGNTAPSTGVSAVLWYK